MRIKQCLLSACVIIFFCSCATTPPVNVNDLKTAVAQSHQALVKEIPEKSRIAILNIVSEDPVISDYIIEELVELTVKTRRYRVIDRDNLDILRAEQSFQMSGEVDDQTIVSAGRFLGVSMIITGSVRHKGKHRQLQLRVLDVETAEILASAYAVF